MQPAKWYIQRLKSMSPEEIAWRFQYVLRDLSDRIRFVSGRYPFPANEAFEKVQPGFRVTDLRLGEWVSSRAGEDEKEWCNRLLNQADKIVEHRFGCKEEVAMFGDRRHAHGLEFEWFSRK